MHEDKRINNYIQGFRSGIISFVHPGISVRGGTEFPRELGPPDRKVGGTEFPVTPARGGGKHCLDGISMQIIYMHKHTVLYM